MSDSNASVVNTESSKEVIIRPKIIWQNWKPYISVIIQVHTGCIRTERVNCDYDATSDVSDDE